MLAQVISADLCLKILQIVLETTLKSSALVIVAWLVTLGLRRRSAHLRSVVWRFTLVGLALLPLCFRLTSTWHVAVLPDLNHWLSQLALLGQSGAGSTGAQPNLPAALPSANTAVETFAGTVYSTETTWMHWSLLALLAGAVLTAIWVLVSRLTLNRIVRRALPLEDTWHPLVESLRREFHLRRRIRLFKAPAIKAGITLGTLRPVVILPSDADTWSPSRRRMTISHELAHVKRWDALFEDLAVWVMVLHWFNPLVWFALGRLRIEREMDCDNRVLNAGAKPSEYAQQLLEIASDLTATRSPNWSMVGLSEGSHLRDRLLHVLNQSVPRSASPLKQSLLVGALLLAIALPLAVVNPWQEAKALDTLESVVLPEKSQMYWGSKPEKKRNQSGAYVLEKVLQQQGLAQATTLAKQWLAIDPLKRPLYVEEGEINDLGYRLLGENRVLDAIGIFQLNVAAFPESWNVYDSLGEACLINDDLVAAYKHYNRSIQLGSQNLEKATQYIAQLETQKQIQSQKQKDTQATSP